MSDVTRLPPCCKDCGRRMVAAFQAEVKAGKLHEAWACLRCAQAYVMPTKPAEFITFIIKQADNG